MKPKQCLCIKNGYMTTREQFCIKGYKYDYKRDNYKEHDYLVRTIKCDSISHSMTKGFFHKYFSKIDDIMDEMSDDDFKI